MFWSIRTKFLFAFVLSVTLTLMVAITISYTSIDSAYMSLNEHSTSTEFHQISREIEILLSETDSLLTSRITSHAAIGQISQYEKLPIPELSHAVNDLAREVMTIISVSKYIDSVYVYVVEDWFLALSMLNTRQFYNTGYDWPSERMLDLFRRADATTNIAGNITQKDFPLEMKEDAYLSLYKKAYNVHGASTYCVNIKESALYEKYAGFLESGERQIRILDMQGIIVSSADKSEIGSGMEVLEGRDLSSSGSVNVDGVVTCYMPMENYDLVIVSSIPISIYTRELTIIRNRLLIIFALGMIVTSTFFCYWIGRKLMPIKELRVGMKSAGQGDYSRRIPVKGSDELSELTENYNAMLTDLQNLTDHQKQSEIELRERELAVLRNEINPHFLFNTLNTIKCMADLDGNTDVSRCIMALGGIIAPLYKSEGPTWSLREEVKQVSKYLEIMNIRYGNGILYDHSISEEALNLQVMKFILQPIIENSIMHGFSDRSYQGSIKLTAKICDHYLLLCVEDNGKGMTQEELVLFNESLRQGIETGGVGMMNVGRRIALRYGSEFGMKLLSSASGGLCTQIMLPIEEKN